MPQEKNFLNGGKSIARTLFYIAIACVINILVFLIINNISAVHFGMNDDFAIQNLLNGSMGQHYTHFAHMNLALSNIFASLYSAVPAINWFGAILFIMLTVSSGIIGGLLMDKFGLPLGLAIYAATLPILCGLILTQFTYTLVCYAMLACALCCLICGFFEQRKNKKTLLHILSAVSLAFSVLLRKEIAASAAVYFIALLVLLLIRYRKKALPALLAVAISFGVIGICVLADDAYYKSSEELADYKRFHEARIDLVDHAPLSYAHYPGVFETVGWSETDANTFWNFTYPDDEKFSSENLEFIYDNMRPTRYFTDKSVIVSNVMSFAAENIYLILFLIIAFLFAFFSRKKVLDRLFAVFIFILPVLFHVLFNVVWRTAFRVVYPHYMLSGVVLIFFTDYALLKEKICQAKAKKIFTILPAVLILVAGVLGTAGVMQAYAAQKKQAAIDTAAVRQAFEYMHEDSENAYMYPIASQLLSSYECYGIFEAIPPGYFANSRIIGGWDTRSPAYNDFKEKYGLETLPKDIIDKQGLYLVIPNPDILTAYFQGTYGITVSYETVAEIAPGLFATRVISAASGDDDVSIK